MIELSRNSSPSRRSRRSLTALWSAIPERSGRKGDLYELDLGEVSRCGGQYDLRKYVFIGPVGGAPWLRLGIFAGIHGDEPAGSEALVSLLAELHETPELARGLELHVYPVCNPSGYEDHTRWARGGPDLNREFWCDSAEPEIRLLEEQLLGLGFGGLISLHADDESDGIYGYVGGDVLTKNLLEPALAAASSHLPRNSTSQIDGWKAQNAIIEEGFEGILSAPPSQEPRPFEIIFETPALAPLSAQVAAHRAALLAIFDAATALRAHAADI
jgi:protein MpaA